MLPYYSIAAVVSITAIPRGTINRKPSSPEEECLGSRFEAEFCKHPGGSGVPRIGDYEYARARVQPLKPLGSLGLSVRR
jgi:hypothetical protein